jgi:hypothetical protein
MIDFKLKDEGSIPACSKKHHLIGGVFIVA